MNTRKFAKDIQHYLPLFSILFAGAAGFIVFSYDHFFQAGIAIATAGGYVTWGIVHHYLHKDLHVSVVVEYLLIALLGLVTILSVIFRT